MPKNKAKLHEYCICVVYGTSPNLVSRSTKKAAQYRAAFIISRKLMTLLSGGFLFPEQELFYAFSEPVLADTECNGQSDNRSSVEQEVQIAGLGGEFYLLYELAAQDAGKVHEICVERILAEEAAYGVGDVIFHHEDDYRDAEDQEQRDLAEVCLELFHHACAVAAVFCPVAELHLAECGELIEDHSDYEKHMELEGISLFEESRDLFLVVCEDKTCKERGRRIDPPFSGEPERHVILPPFALVVERVEPPVLRSVPGRKMSVPAEKEAKSDYEQEYHRKADRALFYEAEAEEEHEI